MTHTEKLKKLGVYRKFKANYGKRDTIENYQSRHESFSDFIYSAFIWGETPEGQFFWREISEK